MTPDAARRLIQTWEYLAMDHTKGPWATIDRTNLGNLLNAYQTLVDDAEAIALDLENQLHNERQWKHTDHD
jgi:hypothetical protein